MQPTMTPPPDFSDAKASLASYKSALENAPVPRLVALSSMGSEKTERLGNITATSLMERAFESLPFPTAFVRAGSFYENYAGAVPTARQTGKYFSFQPVELPFPAVGSIDIGTEVARLLLSDWTGKKIVELGSLTTANQLAAALSKVDRPRCACASRSAAGMGGNTPAVRVASGFYRTLRTDDGVDQQWLDRLRPARHRARPRDSNTGRVLCKDGQAVVPQSNLAVSDEGPLERGCKNGRHKAVPGACGVPRLPVTVEPDQHWVEVHDSRPVVAFDELLSTPGALHDQHGFRK